MSNVSSDAVTAISRELARPGIIWASLASDEGGAVERLRRRQRLRKRAPAACLYSESAPGITVEPLEALGIDPVVGPRGGSALRPRPETHGQLVTRSS